MFCKTFRYLKIFLITSIFFACDKDDPNNNNSANNNATSQNCGTVTVNVDHTTNETFSSNVYEVTCGSSFNTFTKYNGVANNLRLDFEFICMPNPSSANQTSPVIEIGINYHYSDGWGAADYDKNQCGGNSFYAADYWFSNPNDSIIINLSVDEINYTISGDFTLFDLPGLKPTINVTLVDFPITIEDYNPVSVEHNN